MAVKVVPVFGAARDTGVEPEIFGRISVYAPAIWGISTRCFTGASALGRFRDFLRFMADPLETL